MLTLTPNAAEALRLLTADEDAPGTGVRIAPTSEGDLALVLQPEPSPGDEVVEHQGARVYVEATTAILLANEVLDADVTAEVAGFFLARPS